MSEPISCIHFATPLKAKSKIIAIFSFRYEAHLVAALLENIRPFVHGYAYWDDRAAGPATGGEPNRRNHLNRAALAMGADWILGVDPDERFEDAMANKVPDLTQGHDNRVLWTFQLREMFTANDWRSDGVWGFKTQMRLYPASAAQQSVSRELHGPFVLITPDYSMRPSGINLYHLRHIEPLRGQHRRDTYAIADPERRYHAFGYDYLADRRAMNLTSIEPGRGFSPPHLDDGQLWAPELSPRDAPITPDPPAKTVEYIARSLASGGAVSSSIAAEDMARAGTGDADMLIVAAGHALLAHQSDRALALLAAPLALTRPPLPALLMAAEAFSMAGNHDAALAKMKTARLYAPDSDWLRREESRLSGPDQDFHGLGALWRNWIKGNATVLEGPRNGTGPLTAIVIGYKAQAGLPRAVQSIRDQDATVEIVVVNSGGGNAAGLLAQHLPHIRLFDIPERLFVGAARNIGIDASRARYVAFLAGDCVAQPSWVSGRVARHTAGAHMVSSAVRPDTPRSITSIVMQALYFRARDPLSPADRVIHFGRSYTRTFLQQAGYFSPGLRAAEDEHFNRRADRLARPVWAGDVICTHPAPGSIRELMSDIRRRAIRSAIHFRDEKDWINVRLNKARRDAADWIRHHGSLGRGRKFAAQLVLNLAIRQMEKGFNHAHQQFESAARLASIARRHRPANATTALRHVKAALAVSSQDVRLHLLHARVLAALNRHDAALAVCATARGISLTNVSVLREAAALARKTGGPIAALAMAEQSLLVSSTRHAPLLATAELARDADCFDLALCLAQRALVFAPNAPEVHEMLADLHQTAGDTTASQRRSRMAMDLRETADAMARLANT